MTKHEDELDRLRQENQALRERLEFWWKQSDENGYLLLRANSEIRDLKAEILTLHGQADFHTVEPT